MSQVRVFPEEMLRIEIGERPIGIQFGKELPKVSFYDKLKDYKGKPKKAEEAKKPLW